MISRFPRPLNLPATLPVIALPNCSLFPGARMPLYIFEPRYRQMLADVIEGDRMFCVGTAFGDPDLPGVEIEPFSTAGLLRACVGGEDGTLNLILEGLQRVQFTGWRDDHTPYRLAEIEPVLSTDDDPVETGPICKELKAMAEARMEGGGLESEQTVAALWESLGSDEAIGDFIAYHLVPDVERRQPLLEMSSVVRRLMFLGEILRG